MYLHQHAGPGRTSSAKGNDDWLYKFTVSLLEAYLSIRNATVNDAWSLRSFQDHVFAASAVMEAAGFLMGLSLYFWGKDNDSYLGSPLVNFASSLATPMVRLFKERKWPEDHDISEEMGLLIALFMLSLSNAVFLFMYLSSSFATPFFIVLGVLAFMGCCGSCLLCPPRVNVNRDGRAYAFGNMTTSILMAPMIPFMIICFPPFLELLEGAVLLRSEVAAGSLSDSTIVLVILDAVMVAPIVLPVMVSFGTMIVACVLYSYMQLR